MTTLETIHPILIETYGDSPMVYSLAQHLAHKIDVDEWDTRGRRFGIMTVCWMWFSGGGTANSVADRIERALDLANDLDAHARDRENAEDFS